MICSEREQTIALYAGGDLPRTEAAELEQHLVGCATCRQALESQERAMEWLRQKHAEEIAPAHYAAVRTRVLAELAPKRRPVWWGRLSTCGRLPIGQIFRRVNNPPRTARRPWAWGLAGAAAILAIALLFPARVKTPEHVGQGFGPAAGLPAGVREPKARIAVVTPRRHEMPRPERPRPPTAGPSNALALSSPPVRGVSESGSRDLLPHDAEAGSAETATAQPLVIKLLTDDPNVVIYWIAESKGE